MLFRSNALVSFLPRKLLVMPTLLRLLTNVGASLRFKWLILRFRVYRPWTKSFALLKERIYLMKLKVLSVSQLNDSLSSYIYANPIFSSIRVMGEVFNLKKTPYGYTFLSLKDDMSKISVADSHARRRQSEPTGRHRPKIGRAHV